VEEVWTSPREGQQQGVQREEEEEHNSRQGLNGRLGEEREIERERERERREKKRKREKEQKNEKNIYNIHLPVIGLTYLGAVHTCLILDTFSCTIPCPICV
jgi:hypothetical protein